MHTNGPVLRSLAATAVKLPMKRPLGTSVPAVQATALLGTAMSLRNTGLPDRWEGGA